MLLVCVIISITNKQGGFKMLLKNYVNSFNQTANEIQFIEIFGITKSYDCISYGKTTI